MKKLLLLPLLFMVGCASQYKYTDMYKRHKHHTFPNMGCVYCNRST